MLHHETDLSTKQKKTSTQVRFPRTHEDCRRTRCDPTQKKSRQKASGCLNISAQHSTCSFPKTLRILKRFHFLAVLKNKMRWKGTYISIDYRTSVTVPSRLGITVTKRYGKAIARNRFKRVVREAFRTSYSSFPYGLEINVLPRLHQLQITTEQVKQDLSSFLTRIKQDAGP
jgi:ribonuclease P protein component